MIFLIVKSSNDEIGNQHSDGRGFAFISVDSMQSITKENLNCQQIKIIMSINYNSISLYL